MSFTVINNTGFEAHFTFKKGDIIFAHWVPVAAGATMELKTDIALSIVAKTNFLNKEYESSMQIQLSANLAYVAEIDQDIENKSYVMQLSEAPSSNPPCLQLYKTCTSPVSFLVRAGDNVEQAFLQPESFTPMNLQLDGYTVQAVINGITVPHVAIAQDGATVTANTLDPNPEAGFYALEVTNS
ncbi:hypothetical protein [Undibacterium sp. TJN19]|uniref:hypothetical protein n=1 Tax=Undibacterium sp. TJN19 TaxID=3413055 RepID=UPI003BF28265